VVKLNLKGRKKVIKMTEREFAARIAALGGTAYIAGGWVRDYLRGVAAKDKDYVIEGVAKTDFVKAFSAAEPVGSSFPVYLIDIDGVKCEVAFARCEKKNGTGYKGFDVFFDTSVSIVEDLYRRDTTVNSMAWRIADGKIIDPYNGRADIAKKILRPVSEHFCEDPVRAIRAARQAAELGFSLTEEIVAAMRRCKKEIGGEPSARFVNELKRALNAKKPSVFFRALQRADILAAIYPWLYALIGQSQPPEYHPEGDAFEHTMAVVDFVAAKNISEDAVFCALVHDIGKGVTPKEALPHHIGHEQAGLKVLDDWNSKMTLPKAWLKKARFVISEHMRVAVLKKAGKIVDFVVALEKNPLTIAEFAAVIAADNGGRLPLALRLYDAIREKIASIDYKAIQARAKEKNQQAKIACLVREARLKACQEIILQEVQP
jgi:tRNA nucleotidyltransferase (CCA-adding enzyme)